MKKKKAIAEPFALHANAITTEKKLKIKMQYKLANTYLKQASTIMILTIT